MSEVYIIDMVSGLSCLKSSFGIRYLVSYVVLGKRPYRDDRHNITGIRWPLRERRRPTIKVVGSLRRASVGAGKNYLGVGRTSVGAGLVSERAGRVSFMKNRLL